MPEPKKDAIRTPRGRRRKNTAPLPEHPVDQMYLVLTSLKFADRVQRLEDVAFHLFQESTARGREKPLSAAELTEIYGQFEWTATAAAFSLSLRSMAQKRGARPEVLEAAQLIEKTWKPNRKYKLTLALKLFEHLAAQTTAKKKD